MTADGLPELSSLILMADYFHHWWNPGDRKASKEERLKLIHRPDAALARLYDAASRSGNSPEVRAILLRNALASPSDYVRGEDGESLDTIAVEWIARPLAPGEGTLVAEIPTRSPASDRWEALLAATKRARPGQAITMIGRAAGEKAYSDHQSRREQLCYCWGLLDDERPRDDSDAQTPEPDGVAFGTEFPTLRVADFAALQLGRKLELPWNPSPVWGDAEWTQFRSRVRKAFLRLDSRMWRGILPRVDE